MAISNNHTQKNANDVVAGRSAFFKPAETEGALRYKGGFIALGKIGELMESIINQDVAVQTPRKSF